MPDKTMSRNAERTMGRTALTDVAAPMPFQHQGLTRYVPLLLCGGFVAATMLMLLAGPIDWQLERPFSLWGFLLASALAFVIGYVLATRGRRPEETVPVTRFPVNLSVVVITGSVVQLLIYPWVVHTTTGSWYPQVWEGLFNAGDAYRSNKYFSENGSQLALYVRMLVAPITLLVLPITLFFFHRLSLVARLLGITTIASSLLLTMAQGVNRGVAEMSATIILFLALIATAALMHRQYRRASKAVVGAVLVAGMFAAYYTTTLSSRVERDQVDAGAKVSEDQLDDAMTSMSKNDVAEFREGNVTFLLPGRAESIALVFDSYVTHGYKGLDLALGEEFKPTWGLGFSEFYRHNLLRLAGQSDQEASVLARTYPGQISDVGWPVGAYWATFYVHPASDIGFPGVVVLMGLIGALFGLSWRDTLTRANPLACTVFLYLCILVMYLPANNQLFQGGELAIGFTVITTLYLLTRRRQPSPLAAQKT